MSNVTPVHQLQLKRPLPRLRLSLLGVTLGAMTTNLQKTYERVCSHARETALLAACEAALGWDERTMLPAGAAEFRAEQMAFLAGQIHRRRTAPELGEWLAELADSPLAADPLSDTSVNIRQLKRTYDRAARLPQSLVEELSHTAAMGQHVWEKARAANDFKSFEPILARTFELKRAQADALGYKQSRYDALVEDYEPGATAVELTMVLAGLRDALVPLVAEIVDGGKRPDVSLLERTFPIAEQARFGQAVAAAIGFDFHRGRLDVTAHPFCTTLGPNDIRLTTRYHENFFPSALFSILHEAGHGMYEQGLPTEWFGLPLGETTSLGIHESQSRMWENQVGRSPAFWRHFYPLLQQSFPAVLSDVPREAFFFAVNDVRPSLLRVEADEATYNLHILIRFEMEQALLADDLKAADVPGVWREKYKQYLGIEPPNDADGALQDVHWSAGLVGYFPTYSLGNLYAAQLFETAARELGNLDKQFAQGQFGPLRNWLNEKIHRHGQRYTASQLVERVTGRPLSHEPLLRHLRGKFLPLYGK